MTVEPMTDAEIDWIKSRLNPSAYFQWASIDAHAARPILARLDAELTRADAAEAERDAALARAMPRPMPHGWSKVNHPDPEYVGYRIVGYRMPDVTADGRLGAQMDLVRLCPDLPTPTAAQETPDAG